jgi:hypothetical protein
MIIDSPIISGSLASTGSLTQIGNVVITGSLSVSGPIKGNITGSADSASFATSASYSQNADLLDGLNSTAFVYTSSYNQDSSSFSLRVTNTELTGSSLVTASGSFSTRVTTLENSSASFAQQSGSNSVRLTNLEVTASVLTTASASFAVVSSSFALTSGSDSTRITNLESTASILTTASGSFAQQSGSNSVRLTNLESTASVLTTASASFAVVSSSFSTTSGSLSTRVTTLESASSSFAIVSQSFSSTSQSVSNRVSVIESSYATTGSNIFSGTQGVSNVSNAISFTSTASLYLDGGARITKDLYVSGTSYFNNVTIYGTQSVNYITSSQLNIGTNIITVNTDTPTVRYGGLAVYDSGSTGLTGSLLWDSENNHWIYTNPSASTYSGGMLISGPRASARGCEVGTTSCALMMGQGGDHITSSAVFHYSNSTCFYNNTVIGSGGTVCTTMANASCIGIGTATPSASLDINSGAALSLNINSSQNTYLRFQKSGTSFGDIGNAESLTTGGNACDLAVHARSTGNIIFATNFTERARITNTGIACFSNTVCAPTLLSSGTICSTGNTCFGGMSIIANCLGIGTATPLRTLHVRGGNGTAQIESTGNNSILYFGDVCSTGIDNRGIGSVGNDLWFMAGGLERMRFTSTGIACFACQVCSGNGFYASSLQSGITIDSTTNGDTIIASRGLSSALHGIVRTVGQNGVTCAMLISTRDSVDGNLPASVNALWGLTNNAMVIATNNVERLRITSTGIACFACTVCAKQYSATFAADGDNIATFINSAGSYLYGAGGVFIGSSTAHNCTNLSGGSGALIIRNGATTYTAAIAYNGQAYFCNAVGIGCASPAAVLHVAGGTTTEGQIITSNSNVYYSSGVNFYTGNTNRGFVGWRYGCSTAPFTLPGIHLINTDNSYIVFGTTNSVKAVINDVGNVGIGTTSPSAPLTIRCDSSSGASYMEIATCFNNVYRYVSINAGSGISYCIPAGTSQSPYIEVQGGSPAASGGSFKIRTGAMGSVSDRVVITQDGIACFACQICVAGTTLPNDLFALNFLTMGG